MARNHSSNYHPFASKNLCLNFLLLISLHFIRLTSGLYKSSSVQFPSIFFVMHCGDNGGRELTCDDPTFCLSIPIRYSSAEVTIWKKTLAGGGLPTGDPPSDGNIMGRPVTVQLLVHQKYNSHRTAYDNTIQYNSHRPAHSASYNSSFALHSCCTCNTMQCSKQCIVL